jgi:hypothetical protein
VRLLVAPGAPVHGRLAVPIWIWIERFPDERPATSSPFMEFVRYLVADLAMEG